MASLSAQTEWRREGVTLANIVDWYCAGHNGENDDVDHDDDPENYFFTEVFFLSSACEGGPVHAAECQVYRHQQQLLPS